MTYLAQVKQVLAENPSLNLSGHFYPCTEKEISELEKQIGLKLPEAYKEFLLWSGKGLGSFEIGSDIFYDQVDLVELQQDARDLLVENNFPQQLPEDAFVFWMHGGYMFTFFRTSEGANPSVHFYRESFKEDFAWNHQAHFTDFLIVEMRDQARYQRESQEIWDRIARDWTRD